MGDNHQEDQEQSVNIELSDVVAAGAYANLTLVNHSPSEFVIDFIQIMPGVQQAKVRSRVILAPLHAKRLLKVLERNIVDYEQEFGKIREMVEPFVLPGSAEA